MRVLKSVFTRVKSKLRIGASDRFGFFSVGFHGDKYLLEVADVLASKSQYFIETGTNVGSTLVYVAKRYPDIECFSCEPDREAFSHAVNNAGALPNIHLYAETSQEFIMRLESEHADLFEKECMFWLDAHGYGFQWPLKEEVGFITSRFKSGYILIDDFKVPGLDDFKYDSYQEQICSYDYLKSAIPVGVKYDLYYPNYTEVTSEHHTLVGWGLIDFGHTSNLDLPESLMGQVRLAKQVG